jgi:hypothetical protein
VPVVIAAKSAALGKLSAATPYKISAAHCANSARANARLRAAEPTADAADVHPTSRAADTHPATAGHATSAAPAAAAYVHPASPATTVDTASRAAAPLLGEHRGCNC